MHFKSEMEMTTIAVDISASAADQEATLISLRESFRELRAYCDRLEAQIDEVNTRMIDEHVRGEQWRQKFEEANERAAYLGERLTTFIRENRAGSPFPEFMPIYRHKKRGSTYDIIAVCRAQVSGEPLRDDDRVVVYRNSENMIFVRGFNEFMDGRFEWIW